MRRPILSLCLLLAVPGLAASCRVATGQSGDGPSSDATVWQELQSRSPWVFLGDSNTYAGGYVAILDAWLQSNHAPDRPIKLLNLGMSSETASGLSEVDHPFKRPCVHERLSKVLAMTRPGVVFVCYGMNDGIYAPPTVETLAAYQDGMLRLAAEVRASGAKFVCLTPPVFEPEPLGARGKLGPSKAGRYAYFAPAKDYDDVLQEQADWCLSGALEADAVIDIRKALRAEKKVRLADDPKFFFARDGVHFGAEAHAIVAEKILLSLGAPASLVENYPTDEAIESSTRRMKLLRDAYLSATGKNRPGLAAGYPVWYAEQLVAKMARDK